MDGWEIAVALWMEGRLLQENGEESWYKIEQESVDQGSLGGHSIRDS